MKFLAVDPGKKLCGAAVFRDGALDWCGVIEFDNVFELRFGLDADYDAVVCEVPQVYQTGKRKGDQNDLVDITLCAGAVLSLAPKALAVRPREWKGTVDGDDMVERIREKACPKALRAFNELPKNKAHNAVDAYGLGKWFMWKYPQFAKGDK